MYPTIKNVAKDLWKYVIIGDKLDTVVREATLRALNAPDFIIHDSHIPNNVFWFREFSYPLVINAKSLWVNTDVHGIVLQGMCIFEPSHDVLGKRFVTA